MWRISCLEYFRLTAAPSRSVFGDPHPGQQQQHRRGTHAREIHAMQLLSPSRPDLRFLRKYRAICRSHCKAASEVYVCRKIRMSVTVSDSPLPHSHHGLATPCPTLPHAQPHSSALCTVLSCLESTLQISSIVFNVPLLRKLLNVPAVLRGQLSDTLKFRVLKSVQNFLGLLKSLSSLMLSASDHFYFDATFSLQRRRRFKQT